MKLPVPSLPDSDSNNFHKLVIETNVSLRQLHPFLLTERLNNAKFSGTPSRQVEIVLLS